MGDLLFFYQGAKFRQFFDNRPVGFKHLHARKMFHIQGEPTGVIHRRVHLQPVFETGFVVLPTMAGGRMDTTRTTLERYIGGQNNHRRAVKNGVSGFQVLQITGPKRFQNFMGIDTEGFHALI